MNPPIKYDPPLNVEEIKKRYPQIAERLLNDPVHRWRAETGIELIHEEPTKEELERIWNNWKLMDQDKQIVSDTKSMELFGVTNEENYKQLITTYNK